MPSHNNSPQQCLARRKASPMRMICRPDLPLITALICFSGALWPQAPAAAPPQSPPAFRLPAPHVNAPLGDIPSMPGDGNGAFKTHQYRDLFAEQGHPNAESRAKIEKAFQQLFHGDGQEERLYFETGANRNGPLAYITDWANNDARTEGMSYGMMIAVQLDKKREFDALWNWANTYMLITDPKNPSVGYFAWSMSDRRLAAIDRRSAGRRTILHHGALFCGAPMGQRAGNL